MENIAINFSKFAEHLYEHNVKQGKYWRPDDLINHTWFYNSFHNEYHISAAAMDEYRAYWKQKRNNYFVRFGLVSKEIEILILETTLREHFGETNA